MRRKNHLNVGKILLTTAVSVGVIMPSVVATGEVVKKVGNNSKINIDSSKTVKEFVNINVGKINIIKNVGNGTTANTQYIPENVVPKTGDIGAIGTSFQYNIPIEFTSSNGKLYNLENPSIEVNLNPSGINGKALTSEQKLAIKNLENDINIQIQNYSHNWNTSGSYIFSLSVNLNNAINGVQLNPVMELSYTLNKKDIEKNISLGKILLTRKYSSSINPSISLKGNSLNVKMNWSKDSGNVAKYDFNNIGYINGNHNVKSLSFTVSEPNGVKLTPIDNPELKVNNDGSYTVSGNLLNELLNGNIKLFNISYTGVPVSGNISINLIPKTNGETFTNGKVTEEGTSVNYGGSSVSVQYVPKGNESQKIDKFTLESSDHGIVLGNGNMTNAIRTDFSAKVNSEGGNGIAYVGSCITNGEGIITQNDKNLESTNLTYVELPTNILNELTTGTLEEKEEIMYNIINNKYPSYKSGDTLESGFSPNFVYTKSSIEKGQSKVIGGNYIKIPKNYSGWSTYPTSASSTIVGVLYNENDISNDTIKDFQNSKTDTIKKVSKNSFLGIVTPPNNLIGDTINRTNSWTYPQSTYFRDGEFSHGVSASEILTWAVSDTRFDSFDNGITTYNQRGHGIYSNNISESKMATWLSQPHTINGAIGVNVAGDKSLYKAGTYIRVNFGGDAIVTGNVFLNGEKVNSNDIKIENNYIIIKIPNNTPLNLLKVTVPVQYTNIALNSITTSISPCDQNGNETRNIYPVVEVNGKMSSWGMTGYAENTAFTDTVNFTHTSANICGQYSNGVSKDNTTTITNVINNLGDEKKTYTISGRIPSADNNTLSANFGDTNVGNLSSTLENIDTNGADTWVLPNEDLNNPKNQEILNTPYASTLGNLTSEELKKLGWVKYTKGMNLKNIGAYLVKTTINPGSSYTMYYKIKLDNVDKNVFQTTNAEYKYYDNDDGIGSISPVTTLVPYGANEQNAWMSSIIVQNYKKNSKGKIIVDGTSEIPNDILNKELKNSVDPLSKDPKLGDLISNGEDIVNDSTLKTPEKLMNLIKFAINNESEFEKLGYKLDYISINGVNIAPGSAGEYSMNTGNLMNWLENVGIRDNTVLTKVKFVMSQIKTVPVTVQVQVLNNKDEVVQNSNTIEKHNILNGLTGNYLDSSLCGIKIPKGYELVKETVNGIEVTPNADGSTLPEKIGQSGEQIIYYIKKIQTKINLKIEYPDGSIVKNSEINVAGDPEASTEMSENKNVISIDGESITIPNGYKVAETIVTNIDTGKTVSTTKNKVNIISNFRNYNIGIVIKLEKIKTYTITTEIISTKGQVLVPENTISGEEGQSTENVKIPQIPKGYHLVKVINGENQIISKMPDQYIDKNQKIIWIVEKDKVTPEVKPETKPEVKPNEKPEVKPETKPEVKPNEKPEVKPETKPEVKPNEKPEVKPETKPEVKPNEKPEVKPE
ncbi:MAG: hypothetical protein ACRDDY_17420, partial [Clostridium sp.]